MRCQITGFQYLILIWDVVGDVVPVGRVVLVWFGYVCGIQVDCCGLKIRQK